MHSEHSNEYPTDFIQIIFSPIVFRHTFHFACVLAEVRHKQWIFKLIAMYVLGGGVKKKPHIRRTTNTENIFHIEICS